MPHVVVDVDSDIRRAGARDFWQLHGSGPNWADATEGSPTVWAREHDEWSGNRVVGTTQDSNVFRPGGTWTLTVDPRNGNGSHIHLVLERRFKGKGWLFYPAVALFGRLHDLPGLPGSHPGGHESRVPVLPVDTGT